LNKISEPQHHTVETHASGARKMDRQLYGKGHFTSLGSLIFDL